MNVMLSLCWAKSSIPPELIPAFVVLSSLDFACVANVLAVHKLEGEQRIDKAEGSEVRIFQNRGIVGKCSLPCHTIPCFINFFVSPKFMCGHNVEKLFVRERVLRSLAWTETSTPSWVECYSIAR